MDRRSLRYGTLAASALTVLAVISAGGCRSMMTTVGYLFNGTDQEAEFPGLKEKKVAIVCRPLVALQYRNAGAAQELAQQIGTLLKANVPKIKIIDQQKVAAWADENSWDEYTEVGRAMKADMVVGVDLTAFNVFEGQTLYRGKANAALKVYDLSKEKGSQLVFHKTLPQSLYPPNIAIPVSDKQESDFRTEFVGVLAEQIGRHFYAHDAYADIGQDARAGL